MKEKLIVIGGGAAGFFCAINTAIANPRMEVIIVEKSSKLLSKVRISGGGRCNVTHACFSISEMIKNYPRGQKFLKPGFHQFFTTDTITWFQERGVDLKTEPDGRMFPESNSSQSIIDCLMNEVNKNNIHILMNHEVVKIEKVQNSCESYFQLFFKDGSFLKSDFICIACGGFPKSIQYNWLASLGHTFEEPVPSLFTFNVPKNPIAELMGVSIKDATVKIKGTKLSQRGPVLITHWGFSGPAVLKLSAFGAIELAKLNYDFSISINWVADRDENKMLQQLRALRLELATQKIINRNPFSLPQRLWQYNLEKCKIDSETRWAELPAKQQNQLAKQLCAEEFKVKGKTTYKEEFVTAGGIKLSEVNSQTMESRLIPNLFFAGEILNIDGITGGFNFQNAWTSGWIAAQSIGSKYNG
ncbi:MAG: NAD(P)/FAD-dependent oxidoreductase [Ginsengibacter sp.]